MHYPLYISKHPAITSKGVSLRFEAEGHLDLAPGKSLWRTLTSLKIYSSRDAKSSWAKPSSQPVNLPGARPLMKALLL